MLTALSILVHLLVSEFWCQIDSSSKTGSVWDSNLTGNLPCFLLYSSCNAHLSSTGRASTSSGRGKDRSRRNHKNSSCAMCGFSFFLFLLKKEAGCSSCKQKEAVRLMQKGCSVVSTIAVTPFNSTVQAAKQHCFNIINLFWPQFPALRSFSSLLYHVPPCGKA